MLFHYCVLILNSLNCFTGFSWRFQPKVSLKTFRPTSQFIRVIRKFQNLIIKRKWKWRVTLKFVTESNREPSPRMNPHASGRLVSWRQLLHEAVSPSPCSCCGSLDRKYVKLHAFWVYRACRTRHGLNGSRLRLALGFNWRPSVVSIKSSYRSSPENVATKIRIFVAEV